MASWASAAFAAEYAAKSLPGRHHVLGRDEDERAAEPLGREQPHRLAGDDEVAGRVHRERALPVGELQANHRSGVRDSRVRDENVETAVREHGLLERGPHRGLPRHVHLEAERPSRADGRDDLVRRPPGRRAVEIAHDHVSALGGELARHRAPDARPAAGHERDPACQLLLRAAPG